MIQPAQQNTFSQWYSLFYCFSLYTSEEARIVPESWTFRGFCMGPEAAPFTLRITPDTQSNTTGPNPACVDAWNEETYGRLCHVCYQRKGNIIQRFIKQALHDDLGTRRATTTFKIFGPSASTAYILCLVIYGLPSSSASSMIFQTKAC